MIQYRCHVHNGSKIKVHIEKEKKRTSMIQLCFFLFTVSKINIYNQQQQNITTGWLSKYSCTMRKMNHVDDSASSVGLVTDSFVVSASDISSIFWSGIVGSVFVVGLGEIVAGEFRCCCCSSSYSLIKRFLSGCALFDETDVVGDAADETGDVAIGGVFPWIGSLFVDNDDSCWVSDGDESV